MAEWRHRAESFQPICLYFNVEYSEWHRSRVIEVFPRLVSPDNIGTLTEMMYLFTIYASEMKNAIQQRRVENTQVNCVLTVN